MVGIEPTSGVLETLILPMNYTPKHINNYTEMIFFVNVFMLKYLNICPISVILILVMEEKLIEENGGGISLRNLLFVIKNNLIMLQLHRTMVL